MDNRLISGILETVMGGTVDVRGRRPVGGGCINEALRIDCARGPLFLKWRRGGPADMFGLEAAGLGLLRGTGIVQVPAVLGFGTAGGHHYLLMEYLESTGPAADYWEDMGRRLARMHREVQAPRYGLEQDNYIGSLPQPNRPAGDWTAFFIEQRLEPLVRRAAGEGLLDPSGVRHFQALYGRLPGLLPVQPPSLLHGDLWAGNVMTGPDGKAWLIDPAVYYGNREIELAFTRMFGGFAPEFYRAYQETWPLEPGFGERVGLYNLYPGLVHLVLFGSAYLPAIDSTLRRFTG